LKLIPRFFGLPNLHDFPEALIPSLAWKKKAAMAFEAGLLVLLWSAYTLPKVLRADEE
jgi:hypothetical protein